MTKPLSFIHEGVRYTTLFNCNDKYLESALIENSNVANCAVITGSNGLNIAFKKKYGILVRDIPIINDPTVTMEDTYFIVSGKVTIDGVEYDANIYKDRVEIKGLTTEEEEPVEGLIIGKKEVEPEIVPTPEPVPEPEHELEPEPEPVVLSKPEVEVEEKRFASIRDELFSRPVGLSIGDAVKLNPNEERKEVLIGGVSNNKTGILFGGQMYQQNTRTPNNRKNRFNDKQKGFTYNRQIENFERQEAPTYREPITKEEPMYREPIVKEEPVVKEEPIVEEVQVKKYKPIMVHVVDEEEKKPVAEEPNKQEAVADNKLLKEKLRANFSKEVNEVIGNIPTAILGSIAEFTMHRVDTERLERLGSIYCVDHRWHKHGNWYCIDVVNTASRYFFNVKNKKAVEIPIADCSAWLNAIS